MKKYGISFLVLIVGVVFFGQLYSNHSIQNKEQSNLSYIQDSIQELEDKFIDITIAVAGDVMFHRPQVDAAYDAATKTYDFRPTFSEVKTYFTQADLAIVNYETTAAGPKRPYSGYPSFNSPDESIDALLDAGIDVVTTVNNHCLDTGKEGLRRTVQMMKKKEMAFVGTYDVGDTARFIVKDVKGIKVAILGYTEHANWLERKFSDEEQNQLLNLMKKELMTQDIKAAKEQADIVLACMHWGDEYKKEPNKKQIEYAEFLTREGVDLIMGSHPHVIQRSELLEVDGNRSFVIYSMGNFVSNQRRETLGAGYEPTETGVIVKMDIRKDKTTNTTSLRGVDYTPTWVYRKKENKPTFTYRILPIQENVENVMYDNIDRNKMKAAYEYTMPMLLKIKPE